MIVLRKRRVLLDGQPQLDEDFAGQRNPGELLAKRDHLNLDLGWLAVPCLHVEHLVRLHGFEKRGRFGLRVLWRATIWRAVSMSAGEIVGSGSRTVWLFTCNASWPTGFNPGHASSTAPASMIPIRAAFSNPCWGSAHLTLMWLISPQQPVV